MFFILALISQKVSFIFTAIARSDFEVESSRGQHNMDYDASCVPNRKGVGSSAFHVGGWVGWVGYMI